MNRDLVQQETRRTRIVILGGGFARVTLAQRLERLTGDRVGGSAFERKPPRV
jgi:hypothetical protein